MVDLSGLDIGYDSRRRRAAQDPNYRKMPIADMIFEAGRLGQRTGAASFPYEKGSEISRSGCSRFPTPPSRQRVHSGLSVGFT